MRIAFLTPVSLREWGGVEYWIFNIAQLLSKKHQVVVISNGIFSKKRMKQLPLHLFGYYELPTLAITSLKPAIILPHYPKWIEDFDIIYLYHASLLYSYKILQSLKRPIILGIHYNILPFSNFNFAERIALSLFSYILERAVAISCRSNYQAYLLQKLFEVKRDKIFVNRPFVESSFKPCSEKRHFTVLFVGRLTEGKGIEIVLEAINQTNEDIRWVFIGSGEAKYETILKKISKKKPNVIWKGFIASKKLPKEFSEASVTLIPSKNEAFPNVALQSLACGTPVILSRIPSSLELASLLPVKAYSLFNFGASHELLKAILQWKRIIENNSIYYKKISNRASNFIRNNFSLHMALNSFEVMINKILEGKEE